MDFINKQNRGIITVKFFQQAFEPLLKVAAVFGTCHHGCHIQRQHPLIAQRRGNLPRGNALRQRFSQSTLSHPRFPQQAGIVFLAAAKNLNHTVQFGISAQYRVQSAFLGKPCQITAIFLAGFAPAGHRHAWLRRQYQLPRKLPAFPCCLWHLNSQRCQPYAGCTGRIFQHSAEQMFIFRLGYAGRMSPQHRKFHGLARFRRQIIFAQAARLPRTAARLHTAAQG